MDSQDKRPTTSKVPGRSLLPSGDGTVVEEEYHPAQVASATIELHARRPKDK